MPLVEAFGAGGREFADRLRDTSGWDARFDLIEQFLLTQAVDGPAPTPLVAWADRRLRETHGAIRIAALARELGCSHRYLTTRFSDEVGLAPKVVARQLRFAWAREELTRTTRNLARIAVDAGYFDQAHLNRTSASLRASPRRSSSHA